MELEKRYFELDRRAKDDAGRVLSGTALRYGDLAQLPWGKERVQPGAFSPISDVVLNASHDRGRPLARTGGGGLEIKDDSERMAIRADLPDTREADDVLVLVRQTILRGLSVEFYTEAERTEGDVRIIEKATLVGIGVVDSPAYSQSEVSAVSARMKATRPPAPRTLRRLYL